MQFSSISEFKYLKNSDVLLDKINKIKQFVKDQNCFVIDYPDYTNHISINDNYLEFDIRISIPLP